MSQTVKLQNPYNKKPPALSLLETSEKGSWFLLRTHGEEIAEIEGGTEKEIEDGTYLIQAQDTTVKIQIKTSGLHYDR